MGTSAAPTVTEDTEPAQDWDFAGADTRYLTHGLHEYPARMIPQIAARLVQAYSQPGDLVLDPFCGSGTTLLEAKLAGREPIGNDVNPLAVLLARVKATPIDFHAAEFQVAEFLTGLKNGHVEALRKHSLPEPPYSLMQNLLHWFKEPVARDLQFLYDRLTEVRDGRVQDLLRVILSDTVLRVSNIDRRSSRFLRVLHEPELTGFRPDTIAYFSGKLAEACERMSLFTKKLKQIRASVPAQTDVRLGDARRLPFTSGVFDCAITSPPYGEEKNTVGYARWSKLSMTWLRMNDEPSKKLAQAALGTLRCGDAAWLEDLPSPTAIRLLRAVLRKDAERVREALPFFFGYLDSFKEVARVLKPGARYCVVVGDRSIRREPLDMEKVTVELAEASAFKHRESFFRHIPMKLIPWTTPTGRTISRESIVVLERS